MFGRTELIMGVSRAKNCQQFDFEEGFHAAPQKPDKNKGEKRSEPEKNPEKKVRVSKNEMSGIV